MTSEVARLFDAMADDEELEPWYEHLYARLHAILREVLAPAAGARPRALDAGCGTGFQSALLAELGYESHGADIASRSLARARGRVPGARFVLASVEALPFADGVFDAVTCCGSTLSFVDEPSRALAELGRVLRPGGRLLLECEHRWSLDLGWTLASALVGDPLGYGLSARAAWRQIAPPRHEGVVVTYPGYGRLRLFTARELRVMLAAAGLRPCRAWGIHALTNLIPSTTLHHPALPVPLARLFAVLGRADALLARARLDRYFANSLVVLATRPP